MLSIAEQNILLKLYTIRKGAAMMRIFCLYSSNVKILTKYTKQVQQIAEKNNMDMTLFTFVSSSQLLYYISCFPTETDLILLDVNSKNTTEVELAKKIRQLQCSAEIIYLSSDETPLVDSFDITPFYYSRKSELTVEKFNNLFLSAYSTVEQKQTDLFVYENKTTIWSIPLHSISYFKVKDRRIYLHSSTEIFEFYSSLSKLEESLKGKRIVRTHRSYLVNLRHVKKISKDTLTLFNDEEIPLSPKYADLLSLELSKYKIIDIHNINTQVL
jgi:two-component system response regulator LytT